MEKAFNAKSPGRRDLVILATGENGGAFTSAATTISLSMSACGGDFERTFGFRQLRPKESVKRN
jgi:hypothetical protein